MRIILVFLIAVFSFAYIEGLSDLLKVVLPKITHKKVVKVYTFPKYFRYFDKKHFILVEDCKKSDIIFGNFECDNKPIFALDYHFYKTHKNAVGVFYYRKGRPQLKLKKEALERFFKTIPKELKDYVF